MSMNGGSDLGNVLLNVAFNNHVDSADSDGHK